MKRTILIKSIEMLELLLKISNQHPAFFLPFNELRENLTQRVNSGLINRQVSNGLELYTYSRDCQFDKSNWDIFTLMARGLVLCPEEERIVAVAFPKFFNFSEISAVLPDESFMVTEKIDGSLIIIFHHKDMWHCITKGSFTSEQAIWATDWLYNNINILSLHNGMTYLAEAIYPANRIVVSYDYEGMVLLSAYTEKGYELTRNELELESECVGFRDVDEKIYTIDEMLELAKTMNLTSEGFVVRFENGYRLKIKGDEYVRVHRLISNCTPLAIWDMMRHCDNLEVISKDLPEEFRRDFDQISNLLQLKFEDTLRIIREFYYETEDLTNKELGLAIQSGKYNDRLPFVRACAFPCRKSDFFSTAFEPYKDNDTRHPRRFIFESFRPTGNVLEGFEPSSVMNRFEEES